MQMPGSTRAIAGTFLGLIFCSFYVAPVTGASEAAPTEAAETAADDGAKTADERDSQRLEHSLEILVTAQRVEQELMRVPVSVAVLPGAEVERANRYEYEELQYQIPGLTHFFTSQGDRNYLIRGVGTIAFADGVEGSVGVAIDGVVLGRESMGLMDLADIERVEVLRGPQSTLFGKNASAGVINIVTREPTGNFNASLGASGASDNEVRLRGAVGGSLGNDRWAGRFAAYDHSRDGQLYDINLDREYNGLGEFGARGSLRFAAADGFSLRLNTDYVDRREFCCWETTRSWDPDRLLARREAPVVAGPRNREKNTSTGYDGEKDTGGLNASLDALWGGVEVTSVSAYRQWNRAVAIDADNTPDNFLDTFSKDSEQSQFSQEIRLRSASGDRLQWMAGAYFFDQTFENLLMVAGQFRLPLPFQFGNRIDWDFDNRSMSVFAETTWTVTDRWVIFTGARAVQEDRQVSFVRTKVDEWVLFPGVPENSFYEDVDDDGSAWRVGTLFEATDRSTAYLKVERGYKGPGIDVGPSSVKADVSRPETSTNFELGYRTRTAGNRVNVDLVGFYTEFEDFQAEVFVAEEQRSVVRNADRMTTRGIELNLRLQPLPRLRLDLAVARVDGEFTEFPGADCYRGQTEALGCDLSNETQDLSGAPLNNSPDLTARMTADYLVPLGDRPFEGFVRASAYYRDEVVFELSQDPNTRHDAITLVDFAVGVLSKSGRYRVTAFAKNLFEEHFVGRIGPAGWYRDAYSQWHVAASDRSVGLTVDFDF